MKTRKIHPADLNVGDTILINGEMKTVGPNTVKTGFFGTLVDDHRLAQVEQVLFPKWFQGEITGYHAQV
jgi:hypothetical protein